MSNIEKIRNEIDRLLGNLEQDPHLPDDDKEVDEAVREVLEHIKEFANSLPHWASYNTQKFTPTPSVDIEDVARVQFASHAKVINGKRNAILSWEQLKELAGIFYGFGKRDSLPDEDDFADFSKIVSEDLEEAANEYGRENVHYWYDEGIGDGAIYDDFEDLKVGFIAGAEWQKGQMMKDAVEYKIVNNLAAYPVIYYEVNHLGLKYGDKVKIIIIKEDKEDEE